jgi:hypothetical protein
MFEIGIREKHMNMPDQIRNYAYVNPELAKVSQCIYQTQTLTPCSRLK